MKKYVLILLFAGLFAGSVEAQSLDAHLRLAGGDLSELHVAYSEFYKVQPSVVLGLEQRRLHDDDISVLLFLSKRSGAPMDMLLGWRHAGMTWLVITQKLRLEPSIFYVPIPDHVRPGPPYGNAYGYYRKRGRRQSAAVFDDITIRDLVQLRLVSEHYGQRPEDIIQRRMGGEKFNGMIRAEHKKKGAKRKKSGTSKEKKGAKKRGKHNQKQYDDDDHPGKGWKKKKKH